MLMVLVQGRTQYYERGTRKDGIVWDDDGKMVYGNGRNHVLYETEVIHEEEEEEGDEDMGREETMEDLQHQHHIQQMQGQETEWDKDEDQDNRQSSPSPRPWSWFFSSWSSASEASRDDDLILPQAEERDVASPETLTRKRASTLALISTRPSKGSQRRYSTSIVPDWGTNVDPRQRIRVTQSNGMSSLGQMSGAKARASVSYSVTPF